MRRRMGKSKIGTMKNKILVKGDANLLAPNEILVTKAEGYTVLRERMADGQIKTSVVVPLEEFKTQKEEPKKKNKADTKAKTEEAAVNNKEVE